MGFGPDGAPLVHGNGHLDDVNGDGFLDLLGHYRVNQSGIGVGDTRACLTGETFDGKSFVGCDSITIVPPQKSTRVNGVQINEVNYFDGDTPGWAEFSFKLENKDQMGNLFLNVFDPSQEGTDGWFVQNLLLAPSYDAGRYSTTFNSEDYENGPVGVCLTFNPFENLPDPGSCPSVNPEIGSVDYNDNDLNGRDLGEADPTSVMVPGPNGVTPFDFDDGFIRGIYRNNIPDIAQGPNECAPTSTANSFEWLNSTYDLNLPKNKDEAKEILKILKNGSHMKTSAQTGTGDKAMIEGKLQFIKENNLPLTVEFQDNSLGDITKSGLTAENKGNKPTFDFIFEQLQKGQDVEIGMTWEPRGGHWVTVVGAVEVLGVQSILYNDPADGKTKTKVSSLGTSENAAFGGFLELEDESDNSVDIAVAESPTKSDSEDSPVIDNPFTLDSPLTLIPNSEVKFYLTAQALSGEPLTFDIPLPPTFGKISLVGLPECDFAVTTSCTQGFRYISPLNEVIDSILVRATDGSLSSDPEVVHLNVSE